MTPSVRVDPIVGRRVIVAPERGRRPLLVAGEPLRDDPNACPFCEGREDRTPPESLAVRPSGSPPNGPGWLVRSVPNRFPAVRTDAAGPTLPDQFPATGPHEVIVECPNHAVSLTELSVGQVGHVFRLWRERLRQLRDAGGVVYAQLFKNHGAAAGASVPHAHSQLIGLPAVPALVAEELAACGNGECPFCRLLDGERRVGERWVTATDRIAAFTAYAGRFPYETWLLPRRHAARYEDADDRTVEELAGLLHTLLRRLEMREVGAAYNLVLHTSPFTVGESLYHWHLELLPRLTGVAGFEWATGWFINPLPPEEAATRLRG